MYRPPAFAIEDEAWCFSFMRQHSFGLLVAGGCITPMAFVPDEERRVLFGHVARASPQAEILAEGCTAQAFFMGPHGYVSPAWYEAPAVPTWNYMAVEVSGALQRVEGDALADWLTRLVAQEEAANGTDWSVDQLPEGHMARQQNAITGFELSIEQIEGKAKLSQNKSKEDQQNLAQMFAAKGQTALAAAMKKP